MHVFHDTQPALERNKGSTHRSIRTMLILLAWNIGDSFRVRMSRRACACRAIRLILLSLPEEDMSGALQLALFPGDFDGQAAAHVLGWPGLQGSAALLLHHLHSLGMLEAAASPGRWRMPRLVATAAADLTSQLGLPLLAARFGSLALIHCRSWTSVDAALPQTSETSSL